MDLEEKNVCCSCIGEEFLSSDIKKLETVVACSYCKRKSNIGCSLGTLVDRIDSAFEQHYERISEHIPDNWPLEWIKRLGPEWEPSGNRVVEAIAQAAEIKINIARDVRTMLEDRHYSRSAEEIGETTDFHQGSYYAVKDVDDAEWHKKWDQFEQILKTQTRFFSKKAAQHLNDVFGQLESLNSFDHRPVVRTIGPGTSLLSLFRARVFQSNTKLEQALESPETELAPPPPSLARAGRMNASGISVFYGATIPGTAVAEIRPPVGSTVLVGKFEIQRELKVLDLSALTDTTVSGSIFDPNFFGFLSKTSFLRKLSQRMTRPVMPDDEHTDYLPTQAIADFLASQMDFDGIIFPSAQSADGLNVSLFHHASRVVGNGHPEGTQVHASSTDWEDDEQIISYSISVELAEDPDDDDNCSPLEGWPLYPGFRSDQDSRISSLQLDVESLGVQHVNSVSVLSTSFPVAYSKYTSKRKYRSPPGHH